jgi:hypothetical protein
MFSALRLYYIKQAVETALFSLYSWVMKTLFLFKKNYSICSHALVETHGSHVDHYRTLKALYHF